MRIGIISERLDEEIATGPKVYLRNIFQNLLELDKDMDICLIHGKRTEDPLYRKYKEALLPNIRLPRFSRDLSFLLFSALFLKQYNLDIIHYPSLEVPLAFWLQRSKKIVTVYGVDVLLLESSLPYIYRFLKFSSGKIDCVITISNSSKKLISKHLEIPEEKIKVIYLGVENLYKPLQNIEGIKEEIKGKYGIESPFILDVSRTEPKKNIPNLIKAFYKLKQKQGIEHKLVLVGGKHSGHKEVTEVIDKLNLGNEVFFTKHVPDEDMPKIYNAADLFIFPSLYEGFGLPIVEALGCGTPVITSNIYSMPEIAGDAAILVDPRNVDEMANAMYEVLINEGLRQELKKRGLERARRFSWRKCAQEHLEVYEEVLRK